MPPKPGNGNARRLLSSSDLFGWSKRMDGPTTSDVPTADGLGWTWTDHTTRKSNMTATIPSRGRGVTRTANSAASGPLSHNLKQERTPAVCWNDLLGDMKYIRTFKPKSRSEEHTS